MRIRELKITYQPIADTFHGRARIASAGDAAGYVRPLLQHESVEVFLIVLLDTKHQVIAVHTISRGTLDATLVHPREVFTAACLVRASAIITAHNHPSGVVDPSPDDVSLWKRLNQAGQIMGIACLDHLVIGSPTGSYYSAMEHGGMGGWNTT